MSFLNKNDSTSGELIKGLDLDDDPDAVDEELVDDETEDEADEDAAEAPAPVAPAGNPYDKLIQHNKDRARRARGDK
ncbi:MAG: hypothetical protein KA758_03560 [Acidimicrobiales bacterium]|jgi:hypothetical protein|nr:hypothetical protein [Acidimicrobiales bacterium]